MEPMTDRTRLLTQLAQHAADREGRCGVMVDESNPRVAWPDERVPPGEVRWQLEMADTQ